MHVKTKHPNTISKYRDTHIYTWLVCHSHLHLLLCCIWGLWSSSWQPTPNVIASNIYQLHGNDAISHNQSCLILFDKYQYLLMLSNKKLLNYVKDELLFWRLFWTKKIMFISFRRVDYGILSMYAVDTQWWVLMLPVATYEWWYISLNAVRNLSVCNAMPRENGQFCININQLENLKIHLCNKYDK